MAARDAGRGHGSLDTRAGADEALSGPAVEVHQDRRGWSPRRACSPCCWPIGWLPRGGPPSRGPRHGRDRRPRDRWCRRSRSHAPTGRRARTAPPTTTRRASATKMLACGRYTSWRSRSAASSGLATMLHSRHRVAQGDETIDVGDTGGSDQVFHAEGSYLAGRRPSPLDRGSDPWSAPGPRASSGRRREALTTRQMTRGSGAADRYCIRDADAYDTASLRRSPARRPSSDHRPPPSRTDRSPPSTTWEGTVERCRRA